MSTEEHAKNFLAHHEQLPLCTTRLPYRQGRKLTAVKVYTINNESNHLLIFGVPSLNLRQETKALFAQFGKLLHFTLSKDHPAEDFTETYHARFERIQSARIAKRMIDTKNFYGGCLHVCYAPEFETLEETRNKLMQRKRDVLLRLKNLQKEDTDTVKSKNEDKTNECSEVTSDYNTEHQVSSIVNEISSGLKDDCSKKDASVKINMGEENIIYFNKTKRKISEEVVIQKKFKPCFTEYDNITISKDIKIANNENTNCKDLNILKSVEVVDCTSTEKDIVSNINEALNYNRFGNEIIRKVEAKPENRIIFNINKKSA